MALLTARDPWDGKSALDTAAILGRTEILQYFISKEVGLNEASTKGPFREMHLSDLKNHKHKRNLSFRTYV